MRRDRVNGSNFGKLQLVEGVSGFYFSLMLAIVRVATGAKLPIVAGIVALAIGAAIRPEAVIPR